MIDKLSIAQSLEEAICLKAKSRNSVYLSGGTEVNRLGSEHYESGVSIGRLNLDEIAMEGSLLRLGSTLTFQEALQSTLVPQYLKLSLGFMDSMIKRNMATLGGNIAAMRDDSYIIPTLVCACAKLRVMGFDGKTRDLEILDYLGSPVRQDLLILDILLDPDRDVRSKRFSLTSQSHASLTVAVGLDPSVVCAAIKESGIVRIAEMEKAIDRGQGCLEDPGLLSSIEIKDDMHASADYKRYLLGVAVADLAGGKI